MEMMKEIYPKWGEYYVAVVSHFEGNPRHKVIIHIDNVNGDKLLFTIVNTSYEERKCYHSTKLNYFELVEKIDMEYKGKVF